PRAGNAVFLAGVFLTRGPALLQSPVNRGEVIGREGLCRPPGLPPAGRAPGRDRGSGRGDVVDRPQPGGLVARHRSADHRIRRTAPAEPVHQRSSEPSTTSATGSAAPGNRFPGEPGEQDPPGRRVPLRNTEHVGATGGPGRPRRGRGSGRPPGAAERAPAHQAPVKGFLHQGETRLVGWSAHSLCVRITWIAAAARRSLTDARGAGPRCPTSSSPPPAGSPGARCGAPPPWSPPCWPSPV